MKPTLFRVNRDGAGRLATMACPRGGDWLADEMAALRDAGVDVLVCTLTDSELAERALTEESQLADQAGLTFIRFPIVDRGVPTIQSVVRLVDDLEALLADGCSVAVHCRAGIGRSSLIAAALLVREGLNPAEAWQRIEQARGLPVPDTDQQRNWISSLAS